MGRRVGELRVTSNLGAIRNPRTGQFVYSKVVVITHVHFSQCRKVFASFSPRHCTVSFINDPTTVYDNDTASIEGNYKGKV